MTGETEVEAKARFSAAIYRPRDLDLFRQLVLRACERPSFARSSLYERPAGNGKTARGLSVCFADQAMQYFRNLYFSSHTILDYKDRRVVHCRVVDLESNSAVAQDIVIEKTVERRSPRKADEIVGERTTSQGHTVYRIRATDDALLSKTNNAIAKARRNLILQMLPADVKEEAVLRCEKTIMRNDDAKDPDAAKRRLLDRFYAIGVDASAVKEFVGFPLEQLQERHLEKLRGVYQVIPSGESTWSDYMDHADGEATPTLPAAGQRQHDRCGVPSVRPVCGSHQHQASRRNEMGAKPEVQNLPPLLRIS